MGQDFLSTRIFIKFANYQQYAIMNILVMKKQLKLLLLTVLSVLSFTYTHAQSDIPFNINHGPYLQEVTADGASFNFTTSHPAFSFIELKQKGDSHSQTYYHTEYGMHAAYNTFHSIRAEKLKPGSTYQYRIHTKEMREFQPYKIVFGDSITSQWYTFKTTDPDSKGASLFVASDIHNDAAKLKTLLELCEYKTCDAFFYAGDVMSYMENEETPFKAFIDTSVKMFATSTPFELVRGNHETRGKMARIYPKQFPKKNGKIYGSYRIGDIMIVMIDCGEDKPDTIPAYAGLLDFDNYRSEQATWLKELVKTKEFKKAKYRIVISHYPTINTFANRPINHGCNDLARKLLPILNKANINLMIAGHTHKFAFHKANSAGNSFPVIVGSNQSATRLDIQKGRIKAKVVDRKGQILLETVFE